MTSTTTTTARKAFKAAAAEQDFLMADFTAREIRNAVAMITGAVEDGDDIAEAAAAALEALLDGDLSD